MIQPIFTRGKRIYIIDQTLLPTEFKEREITSIKEMWEAIKKLRIRGAPAIGIAAAFGLYLGIKDVNENQSIEHFKKKLKKCAEYLKTSRPTAVNLFWAINRIVNKFSEKNIVDIKKAKEFIFSEAVNIQKEDIETCKKIGENGSYLIKDGDIILTHCNAGALATGAYGTALSVLYRSAEKGIKFKVYADETRPLLQGARLTTWELMQANIDVTLITDNMAAHTIKEKGITKIIIGADRIVSNGDAANKIGSYNLGIIAKYHAIPLYIAAPLSTFDFSIKSGSEIPIEERDPEEVRKIANTYIAPKDVKVYNPAFDVIPADLITAFITEIGIFKPSEISELKAFYLQNQK